MAPTRPLKNSAKISSYIHKRRKEYKFRKILLNLVLRDLIVKTSEEKDYFCNQ